MNRLQFAAAAAALGLAVAGPVSPAHAADWSDASVGIRYGTRFSEPGVGSGITKAIGNFTYVSGDKLGSNFLTLDVLKSNDRDPEAGGGGGAQEEYFIYERAFSMNAMTDNKGGYGPFKDVDLTARIDLSSKNTQFAPRVRKFRPGFALDMPVPAGFWHLGLQAYHENNHNGIVGTDVTFKTTWAIASAWSIPAGPGAFNGFLDVIGPKGRDGFGNQTKTETLLQMKYLFDCGHGLKAGVGYEYWNNKFGNNASLDATGGSKQNAPMLVAEYHF